jgi:hypothetical protein
MDAFKEIERGGHRFCSRMSYAGTEHGIVPAPAVDSRGLDSRFRGTGWDQTKWNGAAGRIRRNFGVLSCTARERAFGVPTHGSSHALVTRPAGSLGSRISLSRNCIPCSDLLRSLAAQPGTSKGEGARSGQAAPSPRPVNLSSSLPLLPALTDCFRGQQTRQ